MQAHGSLPLDFAKLFDKSFLATKQITLVTLVTKHFATLHLDVPLSSVQISFPFPCPV